MKVVLRNIETGLYMDTGKWIADIENARDFKHGIDALFFAEEEHLSNVEIIHVFPDSRYNFNIGPLYFSKGRERER